MAGVCPSVSTARRPVGVATRCNPSTGASRAGRRPRLAQAARVPLQRLRRPSPQHAAPADPVRCPLAENRSEEEQQGGCDHAQSFGNHAEGHSGRRRAGHCAHGCGVRHGRRADGLPDYGLRRHGRRRRQGRPAKSPGERPHLGVRAHRGLQRRPHRCRRSGRGRHLGGRDREQRRGQRSPAALRRYAVEARAPSRSSRHHRLPARARRGRRGSPVAAAPHL